MKNDFDKNTDVRTGSLESCFQKRSCPNSSGPSTGRTRPSAGAFSTADANRDGFEDLEELHYLKENFNRLLDRPRPQDTAFFLSRLSRHFAPKTSAKTISPRELSRMGAIKDFLEEKMSHLLDVLVQEGIQKLGPDDTLNLLVDLARFNIWPGTGFMEGLCAHIETFLPDAETKKTEKSIPFKRRALSGGVWALCIFDAQIEETNLAPHINLLLGEMQKLNNMGVDERQIYYTASLWTGRPTKMKLSSQQGKKSHLERRFVEMLRVCGFNPREPKMYQHPDAPAEIDTMIMRHGKKIFIEVDGTSHMQRNPLKELKPGQSRMNGSTAFMTQLHKKLHPDSYVLRMRYCDIEALEKLGRKTQRHVLDKMFNDLLACKQDRSPVNPVGAYISDIQENRLVAAPFRTAPFKVQSPGGGRLYDSVKSTPPTFTHQQPA